jgi:hypothetical protein
VPKHSPRFRRLKRKAIFSSSGSEVFDDSEVVKLVKLLRDRQRPLLLAPLNCPRRDLKSQRFKVCIPENTPKTQLEQADHIIRQFFELSFTVGNEIGITMDAMLSRLNMAVEDQTEMTEGKCINFASLASRYLTRCAKHWPSTPTRRFVSIWRSRLGVSSLRGFKEKAPPKRGQFLREDSTTDYRFGCWPPPPCWPPCPP